MNHDGIDHPHQNVLAQAHRQNPRGQNPQPGSGTAQGQRIHTAEHQQAGHAGHAHLIEHEKHADHKQGKDAGQLPRQFDKPAHLHVQMLGVPQEIAEHQIIHATPELPQEQGQQHKHHPLSDAGEAASLIAAGYSHRPPAGATAFSAPSARFPQEKCTAKKYS